ncbi:MAG TPA: hypothetical protein EYG51_16895 [Pseudomonadales bacterium]|nr:hypothetical protein [Pseudomonadales bacterium]
MKITKRQLRRIIREAQSWTDEGDKVKPTKNFYAAARGTRSKQMLFSSTIYTVVQARNKWGMIRIVAPDSGDAFPPYEFDVPADMMEKI